jgi:hypothetical protein
VVIEMAGYEDVGLLSVNSQLKNERLAASLGTRVLIRKQGFPCSKI